MAFFNLIHKWFWLDHSYGFWLSMKWFLIMFLTVIFDKVIHFNGDFRWSDAIIFDQFSDFQRSDFWRSDQSPFLILWIILINVIIHGRSLKVCSWQLSWVIVFFWSNSSNFGVTFLNNLSKRIIAGCNFNLIPYLSLMAFMSKKLTEIDKK
jgi:hypothetical protein